VPFRQGALNLSDLWLGMGRDGRDGVW
jgi:hypothetical protein